MDRPLRKWSSRPQVRARLSENPQVQWPAAGFDEVHEVLECDGFGFQQIGGRVRD
jgi:hypothetical protein